MTVQKISPDEYREQYWPHIENRIVSILRPAGNACRFSGEEILRYAGEPWPNLCLARIVPLSDTKSLVKLRSERKPLAAWAAHIAPSCLRSAPLRPHPVHSFSCDPP